MTRKSIETLILCLILSICIAILFIHKKNHLKRAANNGQRTTETETGVLDEDLGARARWEFNRLKDPLTGTIPQDIRWKELAFASMLPKDNNLLKSVEWVKRGPFNVGGRTRAVAFDADNEKNIIAGGVSGGIWRSTDGGISWNEQTTADQLHNVSCLTQDMRPNKRNIWYYGTGEVYGNSASAQGAYFLGNGLFKSLDSGKTWQSLPATATNSPESFSNFWDMTWNVATDPTKMDSDVVYVASLGTIFQSIDGGTTWKTVLGGGGNYSLFADVTVTSQGIKYAVLGKEDVTNTNGGIYRSVNGVKWFKITPDSFPSNFNRIVMAVNPTDENEVYFLGQSINKGVLSHSYLKRDEWLTFWKYRYIAGDGTGVNGIWTDLTPNLPVYSKNSFNNFYTQGSYDITVGVKPGNQNIVFIGGTNLYRSTDGFTTKNNISQIGGYEVDTKLPDFNVYLNHHPDQHCIIFLPSDPNVLISSNDGGLFKNMDNTATTIEWLSLNRGYTTTQLYTVSLDEQTTSDVLLTGFQDNGNYFTNSADPLKPWTLPLNGDGSFSAITKAGANYYISKQQGKTYKMTLDENGNRTGISRIDPKGGRDFQFVNPFVLDPNNDDIMYMAGGRKLWRNDSLTHIPMTTNWDSISAGWYKFPDSLVFPDTSITALAISKKPANILYYGTNRKSVYRIDNANTNNSKRINITGKYFPLSGNSVGGNVSCIAVDPEDAAKVFVVFSNYNVYSLFYSEDSGTSWIRVGGNLEPGLSGIGPGPSCRWLSILAYPDGNRIYFLGTSTGLYATDKLVDHTTTDETIWTQVGSGVIGNVVVDMVKTRALDNLVVVATHGHGVYSAHINSFSDIQTVFENSRDKYASLKIYPNPAKDFITLSLQLSMPQIAEVLIYTRDGKLVSRYPSYEFGEGYADLSINTSALKNGIYYCLIKLKQRNISRSFIILK